MEMGANSSIREVTQDQLDLTDPRISNKNRRWLLTGYGRTLKKRKTSCCHSSTTTTTTTTTKSAKITTETNESLINANKTIIVEETASISSSSSITTCCSNCTSNEKNHFKFTLASYNLLAPALLQENNYLYKNIPYDYLNWYYRRGGIYDEIRYFDFDIYCFQEMQESEYYNYFYPKLKSLGYYCLFKKRTGDKPDGCSIVFKKYKFHLISYEFIEYYTPNVESLNKENVAIIVLLKPKYGAVNEKLCVATTHLIYSPKRGDVKLAQMQKLIAHIDRIAFKSVNKIENGEIKLVYHPIIICGDMNLTYNSSLYKFFVESRLNDYQTHQRNAVSGQLKHVNSSSQCLNKPLIPQHIEINDQSLFQHEINKRIEDCSLYTHGTNTLSHPFNLKSAYDSSFNTDSPHEVSTCLPNNHEKVDFIFYNRNNRLNNDKNNDEDDDDNDDDSNLKLLSILKLFCKKDVENILIPNKHIYSDHFPLAAKFSILY